MTKKIIVANWKIYVNSRKQAETLLKSLKNKNYKNIELIICPPFPYLIKAKSYQTLSAGRQVKVKIGAQNVFYEQLGHYTGEISPKILKDLGVEYVIIGHSERRAMGETDEIINKKVKIAFSEKLKIILCVGENLTTRQKGLKTVQNFIKNQLQKNLNGLLNAKGQRSNVIIAYEPIWAIGTGKFDTTEDAAQIINFIKKFLNTKPHTLNPKILYGGSVNSKNIASILKYKEIDGTLVGKASTNKEEFNKILKIANKIYLT